MLEPYFKKEDFILCDVPVPKGYPQSQTHAGIAVYNGKFYLTCSPYPLKKYSRLQIYAKRLLQKLTFGKLGQFIDADSYENPLLYEGIDNGGKPPFKFRLLQPAPLMERPKKIEGVQSYNSDPDIFVEDDTFYILNREFCRAKSINSKFDTKTILHLLVARLGDSLEITKRITILEGQNTMVSPCLGKFRNKYVFCYLDTNSALDGHSFEGLYLKLSDSISNLGEREGYYKVSFDNDAILPWHMSLFQHADKLYTIITCVEKGNNSKLLQHIGAFSDDLHKLTIYKMPLTDFNSYRSAGLVLQDGSFILYESTLNEKIIGSKSCDGRDILFVSTNFNNMINKIKEHESRN